METGRSPRRMMATTNYCCFFFPPKREELLQHISFKLSPDHPRFRTVHHTDDTGRWMFPANLVNRCLLFVERVGCVCQGASQRSVIGEMFPAQSERNNRSIESALPIMIAYPSKMSSTVQVNVSNMPNSNVSVKQGPQDATHSVCHFSLRIWPASRWRC
jgi:hypothetical protein